MKEYTKKELSTAFGKVGLKRGDTVLISTELFALGKLAGASTKDQYCRTVLDALFDVIGHDAGTVVVNAYTTYTQRYGLPYHHDRSRPTTGVFSEYVLFHPDSVRSIHPIHSVSALGLRAKEICENCSVSNYGMDSPVDRLYQMNCRILRMGIDFGDNVFTHYAEHIYGLPYFYNKLLDVDVFVNGRKDPRQFFATVRHLELHIEDNYEPVKDLLRNRGLVFSAEVGQGSIHRINAQDYGRTVVDLLKLNPWILVKNELVFQKGVKPYDGITKGRDGVERRANFLFAELNGDKRRE